MTLRRRITISKEPLEILLGKGTWEILLYQDGDYSEYLTLGKFETTVDTQKQAEK